MARGTARCVSPGVDLTRLADATAPELRRLWEERRGVPPPPTLSGRLMRPYPFS